MNDEIDSTMLENLQYKFDSLITDLGELRGDIQFIKAIFVKKQEKKEKRRERKRQKRLEEQLELEAARERGIYENIVWKLRHRPWQFMPMPKSNLTRKEMQLMSLVVKEETEAEIAQAMNIKVITVRALISALKKKLDLPDREDLIAAYLEQVRIRREHRRQRCIVLLSWLLDPPEGVNWRSEINATWKKTFGKAKTLRYKGPYISDEVVEYLKPYQVLAIKLKIKGLDNSAIAARLKIKPTTVRTYFAEVRSSIKGVCGVIVESDQELVDRFRKHPRFC
ncbi:hypothetical protein KF728_15245 [Candidatus Obscuribacterales bacterium]|nr:hypothetical protein [Candidatus Obscuribacterales bacterium]